MGILADQKLSSWHQLLKLEGSEEIKSRLHQAEKQAKVMDGGGGGRGQEDEQEEKLRAVQKGEESGSRDGESGSSNAERALESSAGNGPVTPEPDVARRR